MSQDGQYTCSRPELVDMFDEFLVNTALPDDEILIPVEHQPVNPELEEEVPNQEAANGIARAKRPKEPAWRDLGLEELAQRHYDGTGWDAKDVGDRLKLLNFTNRSVIISQVVLRSMR